MDGRRAGLFDQSTQPETVRPMSSESQNLTGADGQGLPVVRARDLAASYGDRLVWSHASFDIQRGEFVAVLGPNGAGKSTMLKLLIGLLRPQQGTLEVLGAPPGRGNPAIGYVPQARTLDPEISLRGVDLVRLGVDGHRWG